MLENPRLSQVSDVDLHRGAKIGIRPQQTALRELADLGRRLGSW